MKNEKLNLSNTQRDILTVLINLYRKKCCALKTVEIVETMNHPSPGTIRNLMQTMKALKLVRGIPGAKGGYLPTELAYETLGFGQEAIDIPIYRNEDFKVGDRIKIASSKLIICGRVEGRNDLDNSLLSSIEIAFLSE
jgi:predicted transcriptional regulator